MGIMATEQGSALPDLFWDIPGGVYPMYHIFADFGEYRGGQLQGLTSSDPMRVNGCTLIHDAHHRHLLANLTPETQTISLNLPGVYRLRRLDEENAEFAMRDPESYRALSWESIAATEGQLILTLSPYAVITLDEVIA